jgi:hypothetical protein
MFVIMSYFEHNEDMGGFCDCQHGARSGLNTNSKYLKIITTFTVKTLSPYEDYSSLLSWQANICVYIATTELHR